MSMRSSRRDASLERGARPEAARPGPGQIVRSAWPEQWETALEALGRSALTPAESFFVRNHLGTPAVDPAAFRLEVTGLVRTPMLLTLDALRRMPRTRSRVTLECAGNGRARFARPEITGTAWELGAVGTAAWSGVRLAEVLSRAGVREEANHVWLEGADSALEPDQPKFLRSIPLEKAMDDVLLADAMNDVPLTPLHGAPLRAVVPGWYAMASTKWLTRISLEGRSCDGFYMTRSYRYESGEALPAASPPVAEMRVKSLIVEPSAGDRVRRGTVHVRGFAWAGPDGVARVEVSSDGGRSWTDAALEPAESGAWRPWHLALSLPAGPAELMARATDGTGVSQALEADFNLGGYGNNAIHRVAIEVLS
jgi:DMSO/TMAO reductase YedYZ molybdopterin-dependent catalytic subunit